MDFAISYDALGSATMTPLGMGRRHARVVVGPETVEVSLGWGFRTRIPRSSVVAARHDPRRTISRGAHGWRGRWLVNGAGSGLVSITLDPPARAWVVGFPVRLRELIVSAADPDALVAALGRSGQAPTTESATTT